jgi:NAD(P)-dependent dehydrogenase (short-subunit alcohol dehydrogenase family)
MKFDGKVVLITGGAEKAGKIFAIEFARAGADLVISHCNMPQQAAQTKKEIEELGRKCLTVEANNRNVNQIKIMADKIRSYYGRLDVIVHNASNFNDQPIEKVTEEVWNSSIEIILKGAFFLSQAAAPLMLESGGGKIIALIGNSYYENWPNFIPHSIAKVGLAKLMQLLAITYSPYIQCNALCPASFLDSGSGDGILERRGEQLLNNGKSIMVNGVELFRGDSYDVAEALLFLASSSNYINGAVIPLDAGKSLI